MDHWVAGGRGVCPRRSNSFTLVDLIRSAKLSPPPFW